ncbi:MAG: SLBB domain-containing protein [candidate division KSB1 bacterium]|nr:SLBB domain-containing protein [candidate division KSB1 bacterium]
MGDSSPGNKVGVAVLCGFLLWWGLFLVASAQERERLLEQLFPRTGKAQLASETTVALEEPVDPKTYIVGPSDRITVSIWGSPSVSYELTVTPEGTLLVPTVGEIQVAELTLAEVKDRTIAEVRKKYVAGQITVTLTQPRSVVVTVAGLVIKQGSYTLLATERVDKAISLANAAMDTVREERERQRAMLQKASTRNILLRRRDGTVHRVDLARFYATRNASTNPYLLNGDVILVPRRDLTKDFVSIYGGVTAPGEYEFVEGDRLTDLFLISHGLTPLADSSYVEISRLDSTGNRMINWVVDGKAVLAGQAEDLLLQRGDRVFVRERTQERRNFVVEVQGEVRYPGVYPITKESTRLSQVIRSAGGFTEHAFLPGAEIIRTSVSEKEVDLERLLSSRGYITPVDSAYYNTETSIRLRREVVAVDFERLFVHGDSTQDVTLHAWDVIRVPARKKTVYVFGQVVSPGHVPYEEGKGYEYYIRKAGGYAKRARKGDVKIIKGRTKQWLDVGKTVVEEGDNIWVPMKPHRDFAYYMNLYGQVSSAVSVIVGIGVLIMQASK